MSCEVPAEVTVAKIVATLKEVHQRYYKGDRITGKDIAQMVQRIQKKVIKVVGMGAPREDLPPPIFKRGVLKLEDLAPGMELNGTVLNVVDFGAFVDIGMHDSGLVHVSQLADRFVRDPHDMVAVGDIVKVWVVEVDKQRRRVSLTMIPPGQKRRPRRRAVSWAQRASPPAPLLKR